MSRMMRVIAAARTRTLFVVVLFFIVSSSFGIADAGADEIKVLYALPLQPGLVALAAQFHQDTGNIVTFDIPTGADLAALLASDGPADILINTPVVVDRAVSDGKTTGTKTPIGRVGISAVVRRGTPVPDISTVDGLKQ